MGLFFGHNKILKSIDFITNKNGTFAPTLTFSDLSVATWRVSGETTQITNSPSFVLDGTDREVSITVSDFTKLTEIVFDGEAIKGAFDINLLTNCNDIQINNNTELTSIINPTFAENILRYNAFNNTIITSLSFTGKIGGNFNTSGCTNLTSLTFGSSSNVFTNFNIALSNITGVLVLSNLTGLGGNMQTQQNGAMTNITWPNSSEDFSLIQLYLGALGVLNWAALTGTIDNIRLDNNNMTSAEADENIVLIDNNINLTTSLNIAGTNGALTDGSVTGFDGLAAKDSLIIKGVSVTYN